MTQPIRYAKQKGSGRAYLGLIALTWIISVAVSSPIAFGMNYTEQRRLTPTLCTFYNSDFLIYSSMTSFYIPCVVMLILYCKMFRSIRQMARRSIIWQIRHVNYVRCKLDRSRRWTDDRYACARNRFCDLDLWISDLGNLISSWPDCGKYFCKFSFISFQWFSSYRIHKISLVIVVWPWPSTQWPCECHQCHVDLIASDQFHSFRR